MAIRLGDLLIAHNLLTEQQLQEALRAQKVFGGRLGSNLIELGYVSETTLTRVLSKQLGIPCVDASAFENIPTDVIDTVPKAMVEKYKVIPLSAESGKIRIAMSDPTDLSVVDELSFLTGSRVTPTVAPEILINYALEKYYGVRRQSRYLGLTGTADSEFQVVHLGVNQAEKSEGEVQSRASFYDVDTSQFNESRPDISEVSKRMSGTTTHEELLAIIQNYCAHDFAKLALLVVSGAQVRGWSHVECSVSQEDFKRLSIPWALSTMLKGSAEGRKAFVGKIDGSSESDRWIAQTLGFQDETVHCLPFVVNNAPVAFLIAAQPRSKSPGFPPVYGELAARFSYAVQILYLRKRLLS